RMCRLQLMKATLRFGLALLLALTLLTPALATPTRVGGATGGTTNVTYTPTAGNGMICAVGLSSSVVTVSSIAQTNCTWSFLAREQGNSTTAEVWYCASAGSSPGSSISVTLSGSVTKTLVAVEEYNAAFASSSALDTSAVGTGTTEST